MRCIAAKPVIPLPRIRRSSTVSAWSSRVWAVSTAVAPAARAAFAALSAGVGETIDRDPDSSVVAAAVHGAGTLSRDEAVSNAAVIMFGGIETTDGMIANAILHLLRHPDQAALVSADPGLLPAAVRAGRVLPAAADRSRRPHRRPDRLGRQGADGGCAGGRIRVGMRE